MPKSISPKLLFELQQLDTCTLSNAIEPFRVRMRNEGFCDSSIRCMFPKLPPMVGHAVTLRIRSNDPSMDGHSYLERPDWWNHVLNQPAPRVVVIQDIDSTPGFGGFVGAVHASVLRALGCVGVVTNGAVRDLPDVEASGFSMFANHVTMSHAYAHIVEFGAPVQVGGLKITPGDWLHGDIHGVLSIPPDIGAGLPAVAAQTIAREKELMALCAAPDFTPDKLRQFLSENNFRRAN